MVGLGHERDRSGATRGIERRELHRVDVLVEHALRGRRALDLAQHANGASGAITSQGARESPGRSGLHSKKVSRAPSENDR